MNDSEYDGILPARVRWGIYWMLILVSAGSMVGRIMQVTRAPTPQEIEQQREPWPFHGANDKSRWATIRALVETHDYEIDSFIYQVDGDRQPVLDDNGIPVPDHRWYSIDMVKHVDEEGDLGAYSSKPPLLPTMIAGVYWVLKEGFGLTLWQHPHYVARIVLIVVNVLPLVLLLWLMARLVEQNGNTTWGCIYVMVCASLATFLSTFAVTLNNHLPAAVACGAALYGVMQVWYEEDLRWRWFTLAGLASAFAAACELPALSLLGVFLGAMLIKAPFRTLLLFVPAAGVVAAAFFGTNYLAHQDWRPPYAHRQDGEDIGTLSLAAAASLDAGNVPEELKTLLNESEEITTTNQARIIAPPGPEAEVSEGDSPTVVGRRWVFSDREQTVRYALVAEEEHIAVKAWDNWYEFDGAYWQDKNTDLDKIDQGEPSRLWYAVHVLVGHHGIFSLQPIWIGALVGLVLVLIHPNSDRRGLAIAVAVLSVVVIGFYLSQPQLNRNYGGWTCGMRWLFWFTPLWLMMLLAAADRFNKAWWGRAVAGLMLLVSVVSVNYAALNPWRHPWLYDLAVYFGWVT